MPTGTVKWFNNAKGYGFILPDEGGEDLFVHYTSILMEGYKTLKAGQPVSFEVVRGGKGLHATNIRPEESQRSGGSAGGQEDRADNQSGKTAADAGSETASREVEAYS